MDVEQEQQQQQASLGLLLRQARESRQLSIADIARQLNLTVEVIESLEADSPKSDTPLTFVRGYVRAYASKVGLDSEQVKDLFAQQYGEQETSISKLQPVADFKSKRREVTSNTGWFKLISALILIALVGLALWEVWHRLRGQTEPEPSAQSAGEEVVLQLPVEDIAAQSTASMPAQPQPAQRDAKPETAEVTGEQEQQDSSASSAPLAPRDEQNMAERQISTGTSAEQTAAGEIETSQPPLSLVFDFSGDCWVEVIDARDEILAVGIKREGKHMPIEGVPPIRIKLGAPGVVSLTVNDQPYDLSQYAPTRTATFTIGN